MRFVQMGLVLADVRPGHLHIGHPVTPLTRIGPVWRLAVGDPRRVDRERLVHEPLQLKLGVLEVAGVLPLVPDVQLHLEEPDGVVLAVGDVPELRLGQRGHHRQLRRQPGPDRAGGHPGGQLRLRRRVPRIAPGVRAGSAAGHCGGRDERTSGEREGQSSQLGALPGHGHQGSEVVRPSNPPYMGTCENPLREGRRDGRWGGDSPPTADLQPAEADGARCRKAVHGAHPGAGPKARDHQRGRDARIHAAGDQRLLRGGIPPRRGSRVLGGGGARRDGGQREAARALPRRDVPGGERRCAHGHGPHVADRVPPLQGRGRDDRAEARSRPARVRRGDHRRGRPDRALPGKADVGRGVLRHDQHGDLRARAGGARADPGRRPLRLLEGAVPPPAGGGRTPVRVRDRGLLAGHREPDPVPGGQPGRARRKGQAGDARSAAARERMGGRGIAGRAGGAHRGPGRDRQLLRDRRDRHDRPLHGARQQRDREGAVRDRVLRDRLQLLPGPAHPGAGGAGRQELRDPRARDRVRGGRDRRRVLDRGAVHDRAARARVSVQDRRDRGPRAALPDLAAAWHDDAVHRRGRDRHRERGRDARDGDAAGDGLRHDAAARRQDRREPRRPSGLAHDQARDDRRAGGDRRVG